MKHSDNDAQNNRQVYGLLSLCRKAGKVKSGGQILYECIASGEARLVLIAEDASDNTRKKCLDKCAYRGVPARIFGTMEEIGRALGMTERAGVAIIDEGLAGAIGKKLPAQSDDCGLKDRKFFQSREGETYGKDEDI